MLKVSVLELLFEHSTHSDTTCICFKNKAAVWVRQTNDPRLQQLLLEFLEYYLEGLCLINIVGKRYFVEGITEMNKRRNYMSVVIAESKK